MDGSPPSPESQGSLAASSSTLEAIPGASTDSLMPLGSALFDEGLRTHQGLSKFKDVDALAKSYVELEKTLGQKPGLKPLTAESSAEDIAAYRKALGIPEKADDYDLGELSFPEHATPSSEQMNAFRGLAHELHLTPAQVQGILRWYSLDVSQGWTALNEAREAEAREQLAVLHKEYGAETPQRIQLAVEYLKRRFGPEALDSFEAGPGQVGALGNNPYLIRLAIENAKLTGHHDFIVADSQGRLVSQAQAEAQIEALWTRRGQGTISDEEFNREYTRLLPAANPSDPTQPAQRRL